MKISRKMVRAFKINLDDILKTLRMTDKEFWDRIRNEYLQDSYQDGDWPELEAWIDRQLGRTNMTAAEKEIYLCGD